jgi:hypothetical protein
MTNTRKSERVECLNNCQLTYNGKKYKGILENLSNTGALIKFVRKQQSAIPEGSPCSLVIGNDSFMIPGEFTGKAVHSTQKNIGLQFQFTE